MRLALCLSCVLLGSGAVFLGMKSSHYATVAFLTFSLNTLCSHCLLSSAMELDSKETMSISKTKWTLCALGLSMIL